MNPPAKVAVAMDTPLEETALGWVRDLSRYAGAFKVGPVLFHAAPSIVERVKERDRLLFLDLKLHDIPSVINLAIRGLSGRGVDRITIHLSGGEEMAAAAVDGGGEDLLPIGVTVLTSLSPPVWERFSGQRIEDSVSRMVEMGWRAGIREFVCSGNEVSALKKAFPHGVFWVPGIRFPGDDGGDQKRVSTPQEVLDAGADWLVIGRSLTSVSVPKARSRLLSLLDAG